jgi:hypothetical protein
VGTDQAVTQFIPVNQRWAPQDVQFDTISHEVSDMKMVNFPSFWAIGSTLYRWGGQLSNGLSMLKATNPTSLAFCLFLAVAAALHGPRVRSQIQTN